MEIVKSNHMGKMYTRLTMTNRVLITVAMDTPSEYVIDLTITEARKLSDAILATTRGSF